MHLIYGCSTKADCEFADNMAPARTCECSSGKAAALQWIIVPFDFTVPSLKAMRLACSFARKMDV